MAGTGLTRVPIRPRTPHLNGKVKRSHRVDDQEFYQLLDKDRHQRRHHPLEREAAGVGGLLQLPSAARRIGRANAVRTLAGKNESDGVTTVLRPYSHLSARKGPSILFTNRSRRTCEPSHRSAMGPVLSPIESAGTPALCRMLNSRFECVVSSRSRTCRPPLRAPDALPASSIGSGVWLC